MKDYLSTVVTLGICAFISENICNFGTNKTLSKAMNLISSLCIFTAITLPLISSLSSCSIQDINNYSVEETTKDTSSFYSLIVDELKEKVSAKIFERFGIESECSGIELSVNENTMTVTKVCIDILPKDIYLKNDVHEFTKNLFYENTTILITEKKNEDENTSVEG